MGTRRCRMRLRDEDTETLTALFDGRVAAEGHTAASRSWLDAMSAFDADASTG